MMMFQSNQNQVFENNFKQPTQVILVCVYNISGQIITHDIFYKLFSQYGTVNKILIFEKAKVWKAFIEFEETSQAVQAKNMLNNFILFQDGSQIQTYYSSLNSIKFTSQINCNGVDYTQLRKSTTESTQSTINQNTPTKFSNLQNTEVIYNSFERKSLCSNSSTVSNSPRLSEKDNQNQLNMNNSGGNSFKKESYQITPSIFQLDFSEFLKDENNNQAQPKSVNAINQNNNKTQNQQEDNQINNKYCTLEFLDEEHNNNSINNNSNLFFNFDSLNINNNNASGSQQRYSNEIQQLGMQNQNQLIQESEYVNPLFLLQNQISSVLFFRDIQVDQNQLNLLYKICINFGNIKQIIQIRSKNQILMEFQNAQHATQAKDFLQNKPFQGKKLKIFYSNYQTLNKRPLRQDESEIQIFGSESDYKYQQNLNPKQINPPSNHIHIANIPTQIYKEDTLYQLFCKFGNIQNLKLIQKNQRNMCIIKYNSLQESFNAFEYHGLNVFGRKILVSFTRIKI